MEWHFRNVYEMRDGTKTKVSRIAKPGQDESEAEGKIREAGKQLPSGQFLGRFTHGPVGSEKEALEI